MKMHATSIVHPNAELADEVEIGPFCLVGEHVTIGRGTRLLAHVVVNGRTTIGEDCIIHPFATIGASSQDRKATKGEVAYTRIGNRTILREYVSVQRGTGEGSATVVGDDCLFLAYVHIAHNCHIGNRVTMSNLAQVAGHGIVEDFATIGGMTGVHQFTRVGRYAMVGGMTRLTMDAPPYCIVEGNPPKPHGLNKEGLRRAGFGAEAIAALKRCYRTLYLSKLNTTQAIEALHQSPVTDEVREIIEFVTSSQRGIQR